MINFFKNFLKLINYKKNEKFFKRVIFIENKNVLKYLEPILAKYKKGSCIISLTKIPEEKFDNISHYYFDNNSVFSILSLLLKVRLIYATTPDLNNSIFLKSIYNKTKYLYIQHSPASLCAIYNHDAFIHYDYVQVVNKNQYQDVLDINRLYK